MTLPVNLTIIGIGGCGKTFLHKICEHEWFLKKYLEGDQNLLRLYTIDTALGEASDDRRNMQHLTEKIEALNDPSNRGVVICDHYDLPSLATITTIPDLISSQVVDSLQLSSDDVWWLHDPDNGIRFDDLCELDGRLREGFDGGVYRMRAVSKAAFVKATTVAGSEFTNVFAGAGPVAIIVGLGGGTGSGMFIDLAKKILEHNPTRPIWLFAILPSSKEGDTEHLNAAIALTELEYLKVNDENNLFRHVLLSSLDPTDFGDIQASRGVQAVKDFSAAFPYLFINAFENNNDDAITNKTFYYGNFLNLDAYTIEYPIDDLRALERAYDDYLECLQKTIDLRSEICHVVRRFFDENRSTYSQEYSGDSNNFTLNSEKVELYRAEINQVKDIWLNPIAKSLNLKTPRRIVDIIGGTLGNELQNPDNLKRLDDLYEYVHTIYSQLTTPPVEGTDRDIRLHSCIMKYLECLSTVGEYYTSTAQLSESLSRKAHMETLCVENDDALKTLNDIGHKIRDLGNDLQNYTQSLRKSDEFKRGIDESAREKKREISDLVNARNAEIQEYCRHEQNRDEWITFADKYRESISSKYKDFKDKLKEAEENNKVPGRITPDKRYSVFSCIDGGVYPTLSSPKEKEAISSLQTLDREYSDYYYWKYMSIVAEKEGHRLFRKTLSKPKFEEKVNTSFTNIKSNCNLLGISISMDPENNVMINIQSDNSPLIAVFNRVSTDIVERITAPLCAGLNLNNTNQSEISNRINSSNPNVTTVIEDLTQKIYEILDDENGWTEERERVQKEIDDLTSKKKTAENKSEYLSKVRDELLLGTAKLRIDYTRSEAVLREMAENVKVDGDVGQNIERTYKSVAGKMNPSVLPLLRGDSTLATLDESAAGSAGREEISNILGIIRRQYIKLIDPRMLGVSKLTCPSEHDPSKRWSFGDWVLVIASTSKKICDALNSEEEKRIISGRINGLMLHEKPDASHIVLHTQAKPWECGIMFLAAGNYLENIFGFERGGIYKLSYEKGKNNVLHHVLKMNKGKYIVRELLNQERALTYALEEQSNKLDTPMKHDVRDKIKACYTEHTIKDILTPPHS